MRTDVTQLVQRYQLALKYIWNECIWVEPKLRHWDSVDSFYSLKLPLFRTIVADPLGLVVTDHVFGAEFHIVPADRTLTISSIQVNMRNQSETAGGVWAPINGPFAQADLTLVLLDLFDWDPLGALDLQYYMARIEEFPQRPELENHDALIHCSEVKILLDIAQE